MIFFVTDFFREFFGLKVPMAFEYYSTRMMLAAITSVVISIFLGPWFIKKLYELKIGQTIRTEDCPLLGQLHEKKKDTPILYVVLISDRLSQYGLVVDGIIGEHSLVVMPLDSRLGKIPNISAGAILDGGSPVLIMDVDDLVRSIDNLLSKGKLTKLGSFGKALIREKNHILVVDDSLTVREAERKILANRGYHVSVAVDGADGWNILQIEKFDLVITDIDMPRMNGFELVQRIKLDSKLKDIPVMIVSYKDRESDKIKGLEAGANYYLTKSNFHDETLINAVKDLIGEAEKT